jgi:hypothetical protein
MQILCYYVSEAGNALAVNTPEIIPLLHEKAKQE